MKTPILAIIAMSITAGTSFSARVNVSASEAQCSGHRSSLPGQSTGCGGAANLIASEVEVNTSVTNAGSEVEIFQINELYDQCCQKGQTYTTSTQTFTQTNSVETSKSGVWGASANSIVTGQITSSAGTTNGTTITVTTSPQTIVVSADQKKRFKCSIKKLQGKQLTSNAQYYCRYQVSVVTPSSPCGGNATGDTFEIASISGTATTDVLLWNQSATYKVEVEACPKKK